MYVHNEGFDQPADCQFILLKALFMRKVQKQIVISYANDFEV